MGFIWIRVKLSLHKNPYYLAIAEKIAVNFIQKIEKTGYIPLIDFAVKDSNIDTSAGVCAACGLLELAGYVSSVRSKCIMKLLSIYSKRQKSTMQIGIWMKMGSLEAEQKHTIEN